MRTCPFHGCGKHISDTLFACRTHWFTLNAQEKTRIGRAYDDYMKNLIGIESLRKIQQDVLGSRGHAVPPEVASIIDEWEASD